MRAPATKPPGGIVAAIDGSPRSLAALNAAVELASARNCPVHTINVIPPFASYAFGAELDESPNEVESLRFNIREVAIRDLLAKVRLQNDCTNEVVSGRVAREVVAAAERRLADLIIVGKRRQTPPDRFLGGEMTLEIIRMTSIAVLAVEAEHFSPKTVIAATDFSTSSTRAARLAIDLLCEKGKLYLVHVDAATDPELDEYMALERRHVRGDFSSLFREQLDDIGVPVGVNVETVTLSGKPAPQILEFAAKVGGDLIACGPHGRSGLERFLLGSVSTAIVRNSKCATLVVPPDPRMRGNR